MLEEKKRAWKGLNNGPRHQLDKCWLFVPFHVKIFISWESGRISLFSTSFINLFILCFFFVVIVDLNLFGNLEVLLKMNSRLIDWYPKIIGYNNHLMRSHVRKLCIYRQSFQRNVTFFQVRYFLNFFLLCFLAFSEIFFNGKNLLNNWKLQNIIWITESQNRNLALFAFLTRILIVILSVSGEITF